MVRLPAALAAIGREAVLAKIAGLLQIGPNLNLEIRNS
jgi:hypothetical protein